jgi:hypothetical protein
MRGHEPQIGDVFEVKRASEGRTLLGRVVSTSAVVGPTHGCLLVYVYRDAPGPVKDGLLLPPIVTARAPWSRGYFVHLRSVPLMPGDYFERHVFRDAGGRLYDEEGRPVEAAQRGEPVGEWKIFDVDAIEATIAAALAPTA